MKHKKKARNHVRTRTASGEPCEESMASTRKPILRFRRCSRISSSCLRWIVPSLDRDRHASTTFSCSLGKIQIVSNSSFVRLNLNTNNILLDNIFLTFNYSFNFYLYLKSFLRFWDHRYSSKVLRNYRRHVTIYLEYFSVRWRIIQRERSV